VVEMAGPAQPQVEQAQRDTMHPVTGAEAAVVAARVLTRVPPVGTEEPEGPVLLLSGGGSLELERMMSDDLRGSYLYCLSCEGSS